MPRDDARLKQPGGGFGLNRNAGIWQDLIGIIAPDGGVFREHIAHRAVTTNAPLAAGRGEYGCRMSNQTYGVYTPTNRPWADWEPADDIYTFACMVELTAYGGTNSLAGNTSGSSGFSVGQRFSDGSFSAAAGGGVNIGGASSGIWRLNKPQVAAVTYDDTIGVAQTFMDGVYHAQATGLGGTTYDSFCRPFMGSTQTNGAMTGVAYWMALWGRVLSRGELLEMAVRPWQVWLPEPGWSADIAATAAAFNPAWNASANTTIQSGAMSA